jgi:hypothetical protein
MAGIIKGVAQEFTLFVKEKTLIEQKLLPHEEAKIPKKTETL